MSPPPKRPCGAIGTQRGASIPLGCLDARTGIARPPHGDRTASMGASL